MSIQHRVAFLRSLDKTGFATDEVRDSCPAFDALMDTSPYLSKGSFHTIIPALLENELFIEEVAEHCKSIPNYVRWLDQIRKGGVDANDCSKCGMCHAHAHPVDMLIRSTNKPLPFGMGYEMEQETPSIDVDEAYTLVHESIGSSIEKARKTKDRCCVIVNVDSGVGKTHALLDYLQDGIIYAFRTHALKEEFVAGVTRDVFVWKDPKGLSEEEIRYQQSEYRKTTLPIITTHAKAFHDKEERIVVCDEDPVNEYFSALLFSFEDLGTLADFCEEDHPSIMDKLGTIMSSTKKMPVFTPEESSILRDIARREGVKDIAYILSGGTKSISAKYGIQIVPGYRKIPNKLIILSATPRSEWKSVFPKKKFFHVTFPRVKLVGEVIQCPDFPGVNKGAVKDLTEEVLDAIYDFFSFLGDVWMFIAKKDLSMNKDVYVWNCSGTNKFNGENVVFAGCPYPSPLALMNSLHIRGKTKRLPKPGFKYGMDYGNSSINKMNREIMHGEIKQATGRARLVRNPALVVILTSEDVGNYRTVLYKDLGAEVKRILDSR